jgi:competence protein ComFC
MTDVLFPDRCAACGKAVSCVQHNMCGNCADKIVLIRSGCPVCSGSLSKGRCGICSERAFYLSKNIAVAEYDGVMKELLHNLKFKGMRRLHVPIARMVLRETVLRDVGADVMTYVPMNARKKWKRGFNQSELIAKYVAAKSGIPFHHLLKEKRKTETQRELSLRQRFINAIDRYYTQNNTIIRNKKILIIDDIFTTGSTINECARVLRDAGAADVFSITVARSNIVYESPNFVKNGNYGQYNY